VDCSQALQLDNHHAPTRVARGQAYLAINAFDQALADFQNVIDSAPDNADAYVGRGLAYVRLGRYRDALADAEEAIRRGKSRLEERDAKAAALLYFQAGRICAHAALRLEAELAQPARQVHPTDRWLLARCQGRALAMLDAALAALPTAERSAFWREYVGPDGGFHALRSQSDLQMRELRYSGRDRVAGNPK
jgi:tetratricopeptide (TPR) repeat protein